MGNKSTSQAVPSEPDMARADALFTTGDFEGADTIYAWVLTDDPDNAGALRRRGEVALLANDLNSAERHLRSALSQAPGDEKAIAMLAEVYARRDDLAQATALLRAHGQPGAARGAGFHAEVPYTGLPSPDPVQLDFLATDPLPLISVRLNGGTDRAFLIDTGGAELIVDSDVAQEIGLTVDAETTGMFGGGLEAPIGHGKLDALALGPMELRDIPSSIMPIRQAAAMFDRTVDGIVGTVLLYHFLAEMDYPGGRLVLWPKSQASLAPFEREVKEGNRLAIRFWLSDDHYIVARGQVNDGPPTMLFVDTGLAGGGFTCPASTVEEAHVRLIHEAATEARFPAGTVLITPLVVDRLRLGDAEERNVAGLFGPFPPSLEHGHGFRIGGLISHTFFKPYNVVFDFTNMRLLMKRESDGP